MLKPRKVILFQGRVGDTAEGNVPGASSLAHELANQLGMPLKAIGSPSPLQRSGWREALHDGRDSLDELATAVNEEATAGFAPLCVLPTDASSIAVHAAALRDLSDVSLLWFDAHADFNTPASTSSGFLGGMALAGSCGLWNTGIAPAITPDQVVILGARAIDPAEQKLLDQHRVAIAGPKEARTVLSRANLGQSVFVHLDLDCLEPGLVPTQFREPDGFDEAELIALLELVAETQKIAGVSLSEFFETGDLAETQRGSAVAERIL
jgi:arginase/N-omega-hydroxy-L-arginine amidinohydrolase